MSVQRVVSELALQFKLQGRQLRGNGVGVGFSDKCTVLDRMRKDGKEQGGGGGGEGKHHLTSPGLY